jgi:phosphoribosylformimino-5-aminoimidazole carboxamide ribotide isomerase
LKDGACVRLKQGDMNEATVFSLDPAAQAKAFEDAGFECLHLVDLNGAFEGKPINRSAVESILKTIKIPVQLGGGIRDLEMIEAWLAAGIRRVILGTVALKNPALVKHAAQKFPDQIVVGIDARDGLVAVEGWAESSTLTTLDLAKRFEDAGVAAIIFTDIGRDGLLKGLNLEATLTLANAIKIPVIASGGLASMDDINRLVQPDCAILEGAISGRALYDGRLDPKSALKLISEAVR